MKRLHIVSLMICLSILAVTPVFAYAIEATYVNSTYPTADPMYPALSPWISTKISPHGYMWGCSPHVAGDSIGVINSPPCGPTDQGCLGFSTTIYNYSNILSPCVGVSPEDLCMSVPVCTAGDNLIVINYEPTSNWNWTIASWQWQAIPPAGPSCSFEASPLSGTSPLLVTFNDTSTYIPTSWYWEVRDNATHVLALSSVVQSFTNYVNGEGKEFDVNLSASNAFGNCVLTKPKYITTTGTNTTTQNLVIEAKDYLTGALVDSTNISVKNTATGAWTNETFTYGIHGFSYAYLTPLYIEATAPGYAKSTKSWTVTSVPEYDLWMLMYPGTTPPVWNVSLNVVIFDATTLNPMPNVQVRLSDGQVKATTAAGVSTFTVLNLTSYQITASYPGYQSGTKTLTTGASGTSQDTYLTLSRIVVTTATTLPPGVTAVTTLDTRTAMEKDMAMMDLIRQYAPTLIMLAIMMTAMYLVGYKP